MPRPSPVRDAIRTLIQDSPRHDWSADEVLTDLQGRGIAADFSSVWRALVSLESAGAIRRLNLGDGKARYEAAIAHHEHVRCERCGTVAEVPGCSVERAQAEAEMATGYLITGHVVVYSGLCRNCAAPRP